jgi:hypothetical protein
MHWVLCFAGGCVVCMVTCGVNIFHRCGLDRNQMLLHSDCRRSGGISYACLRITSAMSNSNDRCLAKAARPFQLQHRLDREVSEKHVGIMRRCHTGMCWKYRHVVHERKLVEGSSFKVTTS